MANFFGAVIILIFIAVIITMYFLKNENIKETQYQKAKRKFDEKKAELEKIKQFKQDIENGKTRTDQDRVIDTELVKAIEKQFFAKERMTTEKAKMIFDNDKKNIFTEMKKNNKEKGNIYEKYVAEHYKSQGYDVLEHGMEYGWRDKGIDLIAKKEGEVIMIQCKNWDITKKARIKKEHIEKFIDAVESFINKNTVYRDYSVKKIYAIAEPILDKSAITYIKENQHLVRYLHLPMP